MTLELIRGSIQEPGDSKEFEGIVYRSQRMQRICNIIRGVAGRNVNVLITGRTGTGKELVARALHKVGNRSTQPFIAANCSQFEKGMVESNLFGHTKGAFTSAVAERRGFFLAANKGILFLDEISELDFPIQAKLNRAIQFGEIVKVGGDVVEHVDVRVVAASNQSIEIMIEQNRFREDLFQRLNVVPIYIPPLNERKEDILPLIEHFLKKFSQKHGIAIPFLADETAKDLVNRTWKGNVRELENYIEKWVLFSSCKIDMHDDSFGERDVIEKVQSFLSLIPDTGKMPMLSEAEAALRKILIPAALKVTHGNQLQAATLLGINRNTLRAYIEQYDIDTSKHALQD